MACTNQLSRCSAKGTNVQAFQPGRAPFRHRASVCQCRCQAAKETASNAAQFPIRLGAAAGLISLGMALTQPCFADLNKYEAAAGGEFGVGTAMQYGDAELRGKDFSNQVRAHDKDHTCTSTFAVHMPVCAVLHSTCRGAVLHCRISGGLTSHQQMHVMPTSREPSCRAAISSKQ